jgi:hypothetical protein
MRRLTIRYGSRKRLARVVGIPLTSLSRGIREGAYSFGTCLRIAETTDEPFLYVLRCAGKAKEADVLEGLIEQGARARLHLDPELLEAWALLPERERQAVRVLVVGTLVPPSA